MIKFFKSNLFFFIFLFLVGFAVYGKSVNFGITNLDDNTLVTRNTDYLSDIKNIPSLFFTDCYLTKDTQYYRPVLSVSFALETALFKNSLKIYHTANIVLFILSLISIFVFLSKLNFNDSVLKFLVLLFAVHPVLSSIPVWLPARNDSLLTILFVLSLLNFINYLKTDKKSYFFLYLVFFALSLFTKETTILLTITYPLLCYCFNIKFTKKQFFSVFISVLCIFAFYFILRYFSVAHTDTNLYLSNWKYYLNNIIFGSMIYIEKIFYPKHIPIMLYNIKPNIFTWFISIPLFVLLVMYFVFSTKEKKKTMFFALSFSFLAILPTFALEEYVFLTHRIIICLTGILIIIHTFLETLITTFPKIKKYLLTLFLFFFILFSFCSFIQIEKFKDSFTYWSYAYNDAPDYYVTCSGLAKEYSYIKDFEKAKKLSLEAINLNKNIYNCIIYAEILFFNREMELSKQIFYQLLELNKRQFTIYTNLCNIYLVEGNIEKAIECAKNAINYSNSVVNKINTMEKLAQLYAISGNYQDSLQILFDLIKYSKKANYYYNIGLLYKDLNDLEKSVIYVRKASEIEPSNEDYINLLKDIESKLSAK